MKKTIYIDWEEREVFTEKEFEEELTEEREQLINDDEAFEYWLECNYTTLEIWKMTLVEKAQMLTKYKEYCNELAKKNLLSEWDGYIEKIEIEV